MNFLHNFSLRRQITEKVLRGSQTVTPLLAMIVVKTYIIVKREKSRYKRVTTKCHPIIITNRIPYKKKMKSFFIYIRFLFMYLCIRLLFMFYIWYICFYLYL